MQFHRPICLSILFGFLILGCESTPPESKVVSNPPVFRPSAPKEINSFEQLFGTILTISRNDLKLPVVDPLKVTFYKTSQSFAKSVRRRTTRDVSKLVAVTLESQIHVNQEVIGERPWAGQIWLWAHEYAHALHQSLGGESVNPIVWFSEGFAEWLAAQTLNSLGWQDYSTTLHRTQHELIRQQDNLPKLSLLRDVHGWNEVSQQPNSWARTYSLAFYSVAQIIESHGVAALINYLTSGDFDGIFHEPQEKFEGRVLQLLEEGKRPNLATFAASRPSWKVGNQWTYNQKSPEGQKTIIKTVVRKDKISDMSAYVVQVGSEEHYYAESSLGLIAVANGGRMVSRVTNAGGFFLWPLEVGRKWRHSYDLEEFETKSTRQFDREMIITGVKKITLVAKEFDAIKIDGYGHNSGRMLAEYWYSPKVGWFVKSRLYKPEGVVEENLVSFRLN